MKTTFKLTGLSKPASFTCETDEGTIFWAKNGMSESDFQSLFNYCEGHWEDKKIVEIEHDGYFKDGIPKNPVAISIIEIN